MKRIGIVSLGFAGVILPFILAQWILGMAFRPATAGVPIPLYASVPAYSVALAVAVAMYVLCAKLLRRNIEPSDREFGLDKKEDIPY